MFICLDIVSPMVSNLLLMVSCLSLVLYLSWSLCLSEAHISCSHMYLIISCVSRYHVSLVVSYIFLSHVCLYRSYSQRSLIISVQTCMLFMHFFNELHAWWCICYIVLCVGQSIVFVILTHWWNYRSLINLLYLFQHKNS